MLRVIVSKIHYANGEKLKLDKPIECWLSGDSIPFILSKEGRAIVVLDNGTRLTTENTYDEVSLGLDMWYRATRFPTPEMLGAPNSETIQ